MNMDDKTENPYWEATREAVRKSLDERPAAPMTAADHRALTIFGKVQPRKKAKRTAA